MAIKSTPSKLTKFGMCLEGYSTFLNTYGATTAFFFFTTNKRGMEIGTHMDSIFIEGKNQDKSIVIEQAFTFQRCQQLHRRTFVDPLAAATPLKPEKEDK